MSMPRCRSNLAAFTNLSLSVRSGTPFHRLNDSYTYPAPVSIKTRNTRFTTACLSVFTLNFESTILNYLNFNDDPLFSHPMIRCFMIASCTWIFFCES
jgi:hypothetical protein